MSTVTINRPTEESVDTETSVSPVKALAAVRIALGLTLLWAFLDKTLALGFSTGRQEDGTIQYLGEAAWINGGSPTFGFLKFGTRGPFADFFSAMAGAWWADVLFMLGLLGVGLAFTAGVALRPAAVAGVLLMGMIWASALWPERNPFIDQHVIYGLTMVALASADAGVVFGAGRAWSRTRLVRAYAFLR